MANFTLLNLFDRDFNFVLDDVIRVNELKYGPKKVEEKRKKTVMDVIIKYFDKCPELHDAILKNLENSIAAYEGINYYNCGNSLDLLNNKRVKSSDVNESLSKAGRNNEFYVNTKGEKVEMKVLSKDKKIFKNYKFAVRIVNLNPVFKYNTDVTKDGIGYRTVSVPLIDLRYAFFEDELYGLVTQNGKKIMVKIHAFNNDYVLVGIRTAKKGVLSYDYAVYDRNKDNIVEQTDDNKIPFLNNYFGNCNDLIKIVDDNLKNHRDPVFGMTYYNCNNSKEFIEGGVQFE